MLVGDAIATLGLAFRLREMGRSCSRFLEILLGNAIRPLLFIPFFVWTQAASSSPYVISVTSKGAALSNPQAAKTVATLRDALDAMQAARKEGWGGRVEIELASGVYRLSETLVLRAADSGTRNAPLVIRAEPGGSVTLSGAALYRAKPYSGQDIGVNDVVKRIDTKTLAVLPFDEAVASIAAAEKPRGSVYPPTPAGLQLYQGHIRLTPARWPKDGYAIPEGVRFVGDSSRGPSFVVPREKIGLWAGEGSLWAGAYWGHDWHWETARIAAIDLEHSTLEVGALRGPYPMRANARYFIYNALSELTAPEEFYIDLTHRLIAFRPDDKSREPLSVEIVILDTVLAMRDVHDVVFKDIAFEKARGDAVSIEAGVDVRFEDCFFREAGSRGLVIKGGHDVTVEHSVIAHTGETGADLSGGDRVSLTPSGHRISHSIIADAGKDVKTYRPLIALDGVGDVIEESLLTDAPHSAIIFGGNEHVISGNEVRNVVLETLDSGAIYAGRDWTARGTRIIGNYFHDIGAFCVSCPYDAHVVYLDDYVSGTFIENNVFADVDQGIFINSGRDNFVRGNLFVNVRMPAIRVQDITGSSDGDLTASGVGLVVERLKSSPYQSAAWIEKYPNLRAILTDDPVAPKYNAVAENAFVGGRPLQLDRGAEKYVRQENNLLILPGHWRESSIVQEIAARNSVIDAEALVSEKLTTRPAFCDLLMHCRY
jgi:hypothetical protein